MTIDWRRCLDEYKAVVTADIKAASMLPCAETIRLKFNTSRLNRTTIKQLAKQLPATTPAREWAYLYVFQLADSGRAGAERAIAALGLYKTFLKFKVERYDDQVPLSEPNVAWSYCASKSSTIYVGRTFEPRTRIVSHLDGVEDSRGYGIHFSSWGSGLDAEIEATFYRFSATNEGAIQVLERSLWVGLDPMLGRRPGA